MHSPEVVAHEIYLGRKQKKNGQYRNPFITIWHKDPETDGTDDSCGWFMRARHGDDKTRAEIRKALDSNFDSTFVSDNAVYITGYFSPDGTPNMSTSGITIQMFYRAAFVYFKHDRKKTKKWMQNNLFEIINFAENPVDSLYSEITGQFRIGCGEKWNREKALDHYVSVIYGWLLRETRPWYKHPRWHIHHWSIQIHPLRNLKRRYWDKCCKCGKRGFKGAAMGNWNGDKIWHEACDNSAKSTNNPTELT